MTRTFIAASIADRRKIASAHTSTGIMGETTPARLGDFTDLLMLRIAAGYIGADGRARWQPCPYAGPTEYAAVSRRSCALSFLFVLFCGAKNHRDRRSNLDVTGGFIARRIVAIRQRKRAARAPPHIPWEDNSLQRITPP